MPGRELTFDYNVVLSVSESALNSLFGGMYEQHPRSFVRTVFPGVEMHVRYNKPWLDFGSDHEHMQIRVPRFEGLIFSSVELPEEFDYEYLVASMSLHVALRNVEGELRLAFAAGDADAIVDVSLVQPNNTVARRDACAAMLRLHILEHLREEEGDEEDGNDPFAFLKEPLVSIERLMGLRSDTTDPMEPGEINVSEEVLTVLVPRYLQEPDRYQIPVDPYQVDFDPSLYTGDDASRHSLNVCTFERLVEMWRGVFTSDLESETRGDATCPVETLVPGSQLTVRISKPVIDWIVQDGLRQRFMRFAVNVGSERHVECGVWVSAPMRVPDDTEGPQFVLVSAHRERASAPYDPPSRVKGHIYNLTGLQSRSRTFVVAFETDEDGFFSEMIEAEEGDILLFWGCSFSEVRGDRTIIAYFPQVELAEGGLRVSGCAESRRRLTIGTTYSGTITFGLSGDRVVSHTEMEIDVPNWLTILDMLIGCFPAGSLFHSWLSGQVASAEATVEGEANSMITSSLSGLFFTEELERDGLFDVMLDAIEVHENGVVLSGEIEAGNIRSRGRAEGESGWGWAIATGRVDEWRGQEPWSPDARYGCGPRVVRPPVRFFHVDFYGGGTREEGVDFYVSAPFLEGSFPTTLGLADLHNDYDFDEINVELLKEQDYSVTRLHFDLTETTHERLAGRIFAVRCPWGSYAKVRYLEWAVEWVTYEPEPVPTVDMAGNWCKDTEETVIQRGRLRRYITGAHRYWTESLALEVGGLHLPRLSTTWEVACTVDGPARRILGLTLDTRGLEADFAVDTRILPEDYFDDYGHFRFFVRARVRDVFGEVASTMREFRGSIYDETLEFILPEIEERQNEEIRRPPDERGTKVVVSVDEEECARVEQPGFESSAEHCTEVGVEVEINVHRER